MAHIYGGIVHIRHGDVLVHDSTFEYNVVDLEGGVFDVYSMCNIKVYRSTFAHNRAKVNGGQ